jgi:hypothetical protein
VAAGERGLERGLTRTQLAERTAELDLVDHTELEQPAQEHAASAARSRAGGEPGGGRDQPAEIKAIAKGARCLSAGLPSSRSRPIARMALRARQEINAQFGG